jgi:hypothetical protein
MAVAGKKTSRRKTTREGPPFVGIDIGKKKRRATDQSIRIPQISTSKGAGFGDEIADVDREWAAQREPVAHRLTYMVAADVFDNWFTANDPRTEGQDPGLDDEIQAVLNELNAKSILIDAATYERIFGWGLIVLGCEDAKTTADLKTERRQGAKIAQLEVYKKGAAVVAQTDKDPDSERFGQPVLYRINRGSGTQVEVHHSRTIKISTRLGEFSVLDPVWDDLTCLRNIRWGMAQTMYRYGGGFPVIQVKGATKAQLEDWAADPSISDFMARTFFLCSDQINFEFKGIQGRALDPANYYKPIFENLSVGSGIPEAILRGAQAGELAGSEVNEREYFKVISSLQSKYEPFVRQLIDLLVESDQIEFDGEYQLEWKPGFEPSETTRNQANLLEEQAQQIRLQYMTIDEVRKQASISLDPLPNGEGAIVPGLVRSQPQPFGGVFGGAMDQAEAHPSLGRLLFEIVDRAKKNEISKDDAIAEATVLIDQYAKLEEDRALIWVRNRLKDQSIQDLPLEVQSRLEATRKKYLNDFTTILDDALKAAEKRG